MHEFYLANLRTKIFFAPADDLVAVRLSKMLGTKTEKEDVSASGQLSNREVPRPLMDASELMQLEREQKYICSTATETIKLDPIRSWEVYKDMCNLPAPQRPMIIVDENANYPSANNLPGWGDTPSMLEDVTFSRNNKKKHAEELNTNESNEKDRDDEENYVSVRPRA